MPYLVRGQLNTLSYYHPRSEASEGYVFPGVCHSVNSGWGGGVSALGGKMGGGLPLGGRGVCLGREVGVCLRKVGVGRGLPWGFCIFRKTPRKAAPPGRKSTREYGQ